MVGFGSLGGPSKLGYGLFAFAHNKFNQLYFIIALPGIIIVHPGTNLLDDYADLKSGGAEMSAVLDLVPSTIIEGPKLFFKV